MFEIEVSSSKRVEVIDVTSRVNGLLRRIGIKEGICLLYVPHTTAGIFINENYDPSVKEDILGWLSKQVPPHANYSHTEGNADAHIKSTLVGNNVSLIVEEGRVVLGQWQGIFFAEFDGPRRRSIWVQVIEKSKG